MPAPPRSGAAPPGRWRRRSRWRSCRRLGSGPAGGGGGPGPAVARRRSARSPRATASAAPPATAKPQSAAARISALIASARLRATRPGRPRARPAGVRASLLPGPEDAAARRRSRSDRRRCARRLREAPDGYRFPLRPGERRLARSPPTAPVGVPRVRYSPGATRRTRPWPGTGRARPERRGRGAANAPPSRRCALRTAAFRLRRIEAGAQGEPAAVDRSGRNLGRIGGESALELDVGLATRALPEVRLEAGPFLRIQRGIGVPGQQDLRRQVLVAVEMKDAGLHSQSSGSPDSNARSRRRPWKARVFTVSTGQPTITAISA